MVHRWRPTLLFWMLVKNFPLISDVDMTAQHFYSYSAVSLNCREFIAFLDEVKPPAEAKSDTLVQDYGNLFSLRELHYGIFLSCICPHMIMGVVMYFL